MLTGNSSYSSEAGGLIGTIGNNITITNCYATSNVYVSTFHTSTAGGLFGYCVNSTITNSYAVGNVFASSSDYVSTVGGLGKIRENSMITNCYRLSTQTLTGDLIDTGGSPLTDSQMKNQSNFINWNFTSIWAIDENISYPYFNFRTGTTDITADFTDPNFLAAVREILGKSSADLIYDTDVEKITDLNVSYKNIADFSGIEHFTALKYLECIGNHLIKLDVSQNAALISLDCRGNQLTELDLSNNVDLEWLWCNENLLTVLNILNSTSLFSLDVRNNYISSVNDVVGWEQTTNFLFSPQKSLHTQPTI